MSRVYEKDTDALFLRLLRTDAHFRAGFVRHAIGQQIIAGEIGVTAQTRHRGSSGKIDLELRLPDGMILLIENKIDAGYSITRSGVGQVARYAESVRVLNEGGLRAKSVLVAPRLYRTAASKVWGFNAYVDYEDLRDLLGKADLELLDLAIHQAAAPYEPEPNPASADFFKQYERFAKNRFPSLVVKHNPNADGVRPTGSHTIYFDVPKTLLLHPFMPKPRMSLQCWDSGAPSASVKIMIGGWASHSYRLRRPTSLSDIGAYLRPAGRSVGLVIDTPRLDTQIDVDSQLEEVTEGLEASLRLQSWWNGNGDVLGEWSAEIAQLQASQQLV